MTNAVKTKIWNEVRDYAMVTVAMLSYCLGWSAFLLPNTITTGGLAGISSILEWSPLHIPAQVSYFVINAGLLVIALVTLGWKFCVKTIYAVTVLTISLSLIRDKVAAMHLLSDQPFMAAIIGAVFCGSGVGIGLAFRGSTGGTDIVAAIINKYRDISLGRIIMLLDVVIISCSYLVLRDWEKVIYGYVVLYVTAFCIDQVVNSMRRSVQFFIISEHYKEIGERINKEPRRGVTTIDAHGFYSGKDVKMLFVLAKRRESSRIFQVINEIDPTAFVSQSAVIGVYGEGFDRFKVKHRAPKPIK
ncbi:MAG: YitT family protein [Prevotella sp.]|nr:YitT family protein [Prevotella sp.]